MAGIKDVINTLDDASEVFDKVVAKSQMKIYEEAITLMKSLELDGQGKVKQTIANLKLLVSIKSKLAAVSNNKEYLAGVGKFLQYFDELQKQQNAYFSANFPQATLGEQAKKRHEAMKQIAVQNVIEALTGDGLKANVTDKVNDILLRAVTTGAKFSNLQEELRAHLIGVDGGTGALSRYATTYATTAISQFTGQNNKLLTQDLGVKWFMYTGSTKETTREFCEHLVKKRYIHHSEIHKILQGDIDGHQCAIYAKTGLPFGMIEGTNEDNFQVNCGGWNCRHQLVPVSELAVPQELRDKFPDEKPVVETKPEPIPESAYKADLDVFTEYLSKHKSGKVAGVLSSIYAAAQNGDMDTLNTLIEEAKAVIKKNEASIKSKAAIKEAKKKAEDEAKKAVADAEKQAKISEMLAISESVKQYQGYVAYQDQMQSIADSIINMDEDALKSAVSDIHKIEAEMATLTHITDISEWSKKFTFEELKSADEWLGNKLSYLANLPNEKKISVLQYDIDTYLNKPDVQAVAAAWEVEQDVLTKHYKMVLKDIDTESYLSDISIIKKYSSSHPKSGKVADLLAEAQKAYYDGDLQKAKAFAKDALKVIAKNENDKKYKKAKKAGAVDDIGEVDEQNGGLSILEFNTRRIDEWLILLRSQGYDIPDKVKTVREQIRVTLIDLKSKLSHISSKSDAEKLVNDTLNDCALKMKKATSRIDYNQLSDYDARLLTFSTYLKEFHDDYIKHRNIEWPPSRKVEFDLAAKETEEGRVNRLIENFNNTTKREFDDVYRPITEKQWMSLSPAERLVITKYTQTYNYLNRPLRGLSYSTDEEKISEFDIDCRTLTKTLQKCITDRDIILSRGDDDFYIPSLKKNLSMLLPGEEWVDGGFSSNGSALGTGFDDKPVILVIVVPKGSQAMFVEPLSHYNGDSGKYNYQNAQLWDGSHKSYYLGREFETLLQRGGKYRVLKREKIGYKVKITLLLIGQLYTIK